MIANDVNNPFLAQLMTKIRFGRPLLPEAQPFFNRTERVPAGRYAEVWFRTGGCQWDRQGGCTMCNYGIAVAPSNEAMAESIDAALKALEGPIDELMISPSGSMLDPAEVPPEVRATAYRLASEFPKKKFLVETRAEWVDDSAMAELRASQPNDQAVAIEIGLESCDPWILRFCVNKGCDAESFSTAAKIARRHGVQAYANISLGTAFLSPLEAIEDCITSVNWAFANGASHVVVFPLHIKPYTLHDILNHDGRQGPPSLWDLVEVLDRLDPEVLPRVEIAWYRSYYDTTAKVRRSPSTCPECHHAVVALLDRYRAEQSRVAVDRLLAHQCSCREHWRSNLSRPSNNLPERVEAEYYRLAEMFKLSDWLRQRGTSLIAALRDPTSVPRAVGG